MGNMKYGNIVPNFTGNSLWKS